MGGPQASCFLDAIVDSPDLCNARLAVHDLRSICEFLTVMMGNSTCSEDCNFFLFFRLPPKTSLEDSESCCFLKFFGRSVILLLLRDFFERKSQDQRCPDFPGAPLVVLSFVRL
jgi:hypothetical protein